MDKDKKEYLKQLTPLAGISRAKRNWTYMSEPCLPRDLIYSGKAEGFLLYTTYHTIITLIAIATTAKSLEEIIQFILK